MVSFTALALLSLTAVGSLAAPAEKRWTNSQCMTAADAQQVADNYAELIRNYSDDLALAALAKDFTDYSESVNSLIDTCPQGKAAIAQTVPLLSASFTSRKKFMVGQGQQPSINFKQLDLEYNCNFVTLRWETTNTAPIAKVRPVVGLILLQTEPAPSGNKYPWIVKQVYSEFDSAAWLQNLEQAGICQVANPSAPAISLPSGSVGPAPTSTAAVTTTSVAPASATAYGSTTSAYVSPSASATASDYASASASASGYATTSAAASYTASASAAASTAVTYSA